MSKVNLNDIAHLRICIGFLGETHQYGWWQSSFFSEISDSFLSPVFEKTSFYAKYYGVKEAAAKVHDTHIGTGKGVFHLFRLPENIERDLHEYLRNVDNIKNLQDTVKDKNQCYHFLRSFSKNGISDVIGPVRLGDVTDIEKKSVWQVMDQYYLKAFDRDNKIFPYFSGV